MVVAGQQHLYLRLEPVPVLLDLLRIRLLVVVDLIIFVRQLPVDQRNNSLKYLLIGDNFIDGFLFDDVLLLDLHLKSCPLLVGGDLVLLLGVVVEPLGYVLEEGVDISPHNHRLVGILGRLVDVVEQVVEVLHLGDIGLLPGCQVEGNYQKVVGFNRQYLVFNRIAGFLVLDCILADSSDVNGVESVLLECEGVPFQYNYLLPALVSEPEEISFGAVLQKLP